MKKLLSFILSLSLLLTLSACGSKEEASERMTLEGCYLRGAEGQNLLIDAAGGAVELNNGTGNDAVFDALNSGDHISVTVDSILETYPARTTCFTCEKTADGSMEDIPLSTVEELVGLGWLDASMLPPKSSDMQLEPALVEAVGLTAEDAETMATDGAALFVNEADEFRSYARILLTAPVTEFTAWKLSGEITETGELRLTEETACGSLDEFTPEDTCIIAGDYGEVLPFIGFSFRTAEGTLQHYYLFLSGENGETLVSGFVPAE